MRDASPLRLAVLIGGGGSALQVLLDAEREGTLPATVTVVASHRAGAGGLRRALDAGVAAVYLPPPRPRRDITGGVKPSTPSATAPRLRQQGDTCGDSAQPSAVSAARAAFEDRLAGVLRPFAVDLVVLAGWMLILSPRFLDAFPGAVLNLHPALLPPDGGDVVRLAGGRHIPAFRGAHAVADALAAGVDTTGATIHYAVPAVDRGPILGAREVPIAPGDTIETLHARIKAVEHQLLLETIGALASTTTSLNPLETIGAKLMGQEQACNRSSFAAKWPPSAADTSDFSEVTL